MSFTDAVEDYEASSDWEDWPEGDWTEARKKHAPAPQKYAPPAANRGYVSNATFQTAMDKIRADVAANRTAISNASSRLDTLSKRAQAEVKKARTETSRDRDATASTLQMLAILPLLTTGTPVQVTDTSGNTQTVETAPSTLTEVLPLLFLSGFGGTTGSGGSSGTGGMDSGMLLAVALIASQGGLGSKSSS